MQVKTYFLGKNKNILKCLQKILPSTLLSIKYMHQSISLSGDVSNRMTNSDQQTLMLMKLPMLGIFLYR